MHFLLPATFFCCVGSDQLTKYLAARYLAPGEVIPVLSGFIELRFVENSEGFLGLLASVPEGIRALLLTYGIALALCLLAGALMLCCRHPAQRIAGTILLSGGAGNLLDRLLGDSGGVIDFLVIGAGPFRTGVFNLADLYILLGSFLLGCFWATGHPTTQAGNTDR